MPGPTINHVRINAGSDGDPAYWPQTGYRPENAEIYLIKLATKWMKEKGLDRAGHKYMLDRLPDGYALFGHAREKEPSHVDRYLFGHPKYRFRSVEEFYDHFRCLMDTGSSQNCTCIGCVGRSKKRPAVHMNKSPRVASQNGIPDAIKAKKPSTLAQSLSSTSRRSTEGPLSMSVPPPRSAFKNRLMSHPTADDEGTEDIFERLTAQLRTQITVDQPVEETSFDWLIDRKHIQAHLKHIKASPRFLPRVGEIVLFVRDVPKGHHITFDSESRQFRLYSQAVQNLTSHPAWEAGLVTQLPEEPVGLSDLVIEPGKTHQKNYSGYRIEPMPEVGSEDKPWSKRCAYIPLHQIRPYAFYRETLNGIKPKDYHPTIKHSLVVMSSFSLFEKHHFKGKWPSACIFNRGFFIGSELLVVGDVVCLVPGVNRDPSHTTDVMHITSIKMKLIHLDAAESPEYDSVDGDGEAQDRTYDSCVHIAGHAYTTDPTRAWGMGKVPIPPGSGILPKGIEGYGSWYRLNDPDSRWEVPFTSILGRCYEDQAMSLWFSQNQSLPNLSPLPSFSAVNQQRSPERKSEALQLSTGLRGIVEARVYSTKNDPRIERTYDKTWFWADTRVEQLDLHEVNGHTVTSRSREPQAWQRALRVREKGAGHRTKMTKEEAEGYTYTVGQKSGTSMMKASAVGIETGDEPEVEPEAVVDNGTGGAASTPLQEDEDEDEEMHDAPESSADELAAPLAPQPAILQGADEEDDDDEASAEQLLGELKSKLIKP